MKFVAMYAAVTSHQLGKTTDQVIVEAILEAPTEGHARAKAKKIYKDKLRKLYKCTEVSLTSPRYRKVQRRKKNAPQPLPDWERIVEEAHRSEIGQLGLSYRSTWRLYAYGIMTEKQLRNIDDTELLKISGIGEKCIMEIREALRPSPTQRAMEAHILKPAKDVC